MDLWRNIIGAAASVKRSIEGEPARELAFEPIPLYYQIYPHQAPESAWRSLRIDLELTARQGYWLLVGLRAAVGVVLRGLGARTARIFRATAHGWSQLGPRQRLGLLSVSLVLCAGLSGIAASGSRSPIETGSGGRGAAVVQGKSADENAGGLVDLDSGRKLTYAGYVRQHLLRWNVSGYGKNLAYYVRSPQVIDPAKRHAVLLFLHGSVRGDFDFAKHVAESIWLGAEGLDKAHREDQAAPGGAFRLPANEDRDDSLLVIFPRTPTEPIWDPEDLDYLAAVMADFRRNYPLAAFDFYLAGFSDGSLFASRYYLEGKFQLDGLIILAGGLAPGLRYEPDAVRATFEANGIRGGVPVFFGVGANDGMRNWINATWPVFKGLGHPVTLNTYPAGGHYVMPEEVRDIKAWIAEHSKLAIPITFHPDAPSDRRDLAQGADEPGKY